MKKVAEAWCFSDPPPDQAPVIDDAELVERAKSDAAAFGELYEIHYEPILNYLYRRTLSVAIAEELTSNTFFKALRGLAGFHARSGVPFRAWLYRIATNEAAMHWRSQGVRGVPRPLPDEGDRSRITFVWPEMESPEAAMAKQSRFAIVHEALGRLSETDRTVLMLRYFEALPHHEIAAILNKPVGTVKSLVHRGLGKFSEAIAQLDATE